MQEPDIEAVSNVIEEKNEMKRKRNGSVSQSLNIQLPSKPANSKPPVELTSEKEFKQLLQKVKSFCDTKANTNPISKSITAHSPIVSVSCYLINLETARINSKKGKRGKR